MKNILITGAAGYIGSMLCTKFVEEGYKVTAVDILKYEKNEYDPLYRDILKLSKYDSSTIIHPTNHEHYSKYYSQKSIYLVSKHYQEDLDYFDYNFD